MVRIVQNVKRVELISATKLSPSSSTLYFKDDMEGTLKWVTAAGTWTKDATAGYIIYDTSALKGVTDAGGTFNANTYINIPTARQLSDTKIGVELYIFSLNVTNANVANLTFDLDIFNGTNNYLMKIRYLPTGAATGKWQYWNSAGAYADIAGATQALVAGVWARVKFVIDTRVWEYVKLEILNNEFDLSGIAVQTVGASTAAYMRLYIKYFSVDATQQTFYADNFSVTYNE